jgi:Putative metal-binding motif
MPRWVWWVALGLAGCGHAPPSSPFVVGAGGADAGAEADAAPVDAATEPDAALGGPCLDDKQCDDGIACTFDYCDPKLKRCRFVPDDSKCSDGVFCNGMERCDPHLGCQPGAQVACTDDSPCDIVSCDEKTKSCAHVERDADGDGDPPWNCPGGGDCNDEDPLVSSKAPEICNNGIDDNCNGKIDETPCVSPQYDTCATALEIKASGSYMMSLGAAKQDYSASCLSSGTSWRDVVAAIEVPQGPAADVDIVATAPSGQLALASALQCGDASSETACSSGVTDQNGDSIARIRLRALAPGNYPLYVFEQLGVDVTLKVEFTTPQPKPTNETCGTAAELLPDTHVTVPLIDPTRDLETACTTETGDLVYHFTLSATSDVNLYATSLDGYGEPSLSLRSAVCTTLASELTCQTAANLDLFERALPAGDYYISVTATAPTDVDLLLTTSPPSTAPPDENCTGSPALTPGQTIDVSLANHVDDIHLGCLQGAPDAAYSLDLSQASDVLLVERISQGDTGAISLARPPCAGASDVVECETDTNSPVRAAAHDVPAGSYRAVVETAAGDPTQLTAFTRPAAPPILVAFADTCADAVDVPAAGGFFEGNTANATANYDAGCDLGAQPPGGAPDQVLHLKLASTRRVILDMQGSGYATLLDVRRGPACPGTEVTNGCAAGYQPNRSYLDLTLPAGDYFIQVDGYDGDSGPWFLEVYLSNP